MPTCLSRVVISKSSANVSQCIYVCTKRYDVAASSQVVQDIGVERADLVVAVEPYSAQAEAFTTLAAQVAAAMA